MTKQNKTKQSSIDKEFDKECEAKTSGLIEVLTCKDL